MLKKLVLLLVLSYSVVSAQNTTSLDPAQVYNTGNIVNWGPPSSSGGGVSPWINGVYQQSLTCWYYTDPGNCGPTPTVTPGAINFSYGMTDIHQVAAIANVLPKSGNGLVVNGYNFSFTAKNGNGWDNGQQDYLTAYVKFYSPTGSTVMDNQYNLNYKFDWTNFNFSKTFDTPYASKDLSTVQYGFVGGDSNFWAGTYGPEINNISFGLKYSVDPCVTNPLYSPTCSGYLEALNKLLPPLTVVDPAVETAVIAPTTITAATAVSTALTAAPTTIPSTATSNTAAPATASVAASPTSRESSGNAATGLAVIARNQQREQAIAAQAVQTATATAAAAAADAQQEAASVAAQAVAGSTVSAAIGGGPAQSTSGQGIRLGAAQTQTGQFVVSLSATSNTNITGFSFSNSSLTFQQSQSTNTQTETATVLSNSALLDRSNPLNEFFESRVSVPQSSNSANTGSTVNRNAVDNEAAGGVDINRMALAPQGYGDYLNFALRDAAFYAPREVYRNQRTVDNQRALRQLTNDGRHREMVEQQYRR